jgi:AsmA protein
MNQRLSRWIKLGALVLGALLLVAAAAATYLIATFDANRYKGVAIDWMREHKQRTLAIDGPVSLRVFPRLEVKLEKLMLSEHERSEEFARIDEAALSVDVMPLLRAVRVGVEGRRRARCAMRGGPHIDDLLAPERNPGARPRATRQAELPT